MGVYEKVSDYILENGLIEDGDRVYVGVSGGADSLCLLFLLRRFLQSKDAPRFTLEAVHVNHGIRGESADGDEAYTKKLCADHGIDCECVRIDVPSQVQKTGESVEEAARRLRYEAFEKLVLNGDKNSRPVLALGHHMDDQAETVLHNLFRGSALKGLCGMTPVSSRGSLRLIRPLLCLRRGDTEEYLSQNEIQFRTDETNLSDEYTRNRIRHSIIPLSKEINERSVEHIAKSAAFLAETEAYMELQTQKAAHRWIKNEGSAVILSCECFEKEHAVICDRLILRCIKESCGKLKDIGYEAHIRPVAELGINASSGRELTLPYELVVKKNYDELVFCPQSADEKEIKTEIRVFEREETGCLPAFPNDSCIKWFDYDKINSHVFWRHRQPGDYIVTAAGRSLLKDFLIKQKIPQRKRDSLILLVREENEVLWVMGDDISRINTEDMTDEDTKKILEARVIWPTG